MSETEKGARTLEGRVVSNKMQKMHYKRFRQKLLDLIRFFQFGVLIVKSAN